MQHLHQKIVVVPLVLLLLCLAMGQEALRDSQAALCRTQATTAVPVAAVESLPAAVALLLAAAQMRQPAEVALPAALAMQQAPVVTAVYLALEQAGQQAQVFLRKQLLFLLSRYAFSTSLKGPSLKGL